MIRTTFKTIAIGLVALATMSAPSFAADVNTAVFGSLADTAPRSLFEQIADTAPRSVFDQIADSAPRSIFADIQESAPLATGGAKFTVDAKP
jgi:hypothetical protein